MKKIIVFLLSLTIALSPSIVWASAAEKWEYDVIPDQNQKLKVTGHKVDQFGDAVNDKKYTTTIDPKTVANKQKMGGVAIAKLLKKANWSSVGVEAFQKLLEGIDWVMDLEAQSIWRYKKTDSYSTCFDGKYLFMAGSSVENICPDVAIAEHWANESGSSIQYKFLEWKYTPTQRIIDKTAPYIEYSVSGTTSSGTTNYPGQRLSYRDNPDYVPTDKEKEYLTPDQAADYANHTHPDYTNPKYQDRANPLYKPEIQEKLWKPHNKWEEENSPTVQEAIKQLELANPDSKDDTIKENEPNPETGEKSWTLPPPCDYFVKLCDYIDWVQQEPHLDKDEVEIKTPLEFDTSIFTKDRFQVSRQCPAPEQHTISLSGVSVSFSFDMTPLCTVLEMARPALVACSYLYAAYIVIGAARNG